MANEAIAERVGVATNTVLAWRRRYVERGLRQAWLISHARDGPGGSITRRIVSDKR